MKVIANMESGKYESDKVLVVATISELKKLGNTNWEIKIGTEIMVSSMYENFHDIKSNRDRIESIRSACNNILSSLKDVDPIISVE